MSSIVLSHTKWPDSLSSLTQSVEYHGSMQTESSEHSRRASKNSNNVHSDDRLISTPHGHNRTTSRPFDIIYNQDSQKSKESSPQNEMVNYKSPSYIQIEEAINTGKPVSTSFRKEPAVTLIESPLQRGASIISSGASLRHRNTIKRRNKMLKRNPSTNQEEPTPVRASKSQFNKFKQLSIFPVKRVRSYKYYPISKSDRKQKFHSQQEIDEYFLLNNITSLVREMVPRTMAVFSYDNILKIEPRIKSRPAKFSISRNAEFIQLENRERSRNPTKISFGGEKVNDNLSILADQQTSRHVPKSSLQNSEVERRRIFLDTIYSKYKSSAFSSKKKSPQTLQDVLPFESEMLSHEEREKLSTQLMLEVLLRRTIAAKIDYRLRQENYTRAKSKHKTFKSFSDSNSSSEGSDYFHSKKDHAASSHDHRLNTVTSSNCSGNDDNFTLNTDKLIQNNASLLSELLPSPQISLASQVFSFEPMKADQTIPKSKKIQGGSPDITLNKQQTENTFKAHHSIEQSPTSVIPKIFEYCPSIYRTSSDTPSDARPNVGSNHSSKRRPKDLFIYDFSKVSLASKEKAKELSLGNVDLGLLRPFNRSHDTLRSYSTDEEILPSKLGYEITNEQHRSSSESTSISREPNRTSRSTADTSIIRSLEEDFAPHKYDAEELNLPTATKYVVNTASDDPTNFNSPFGQETFNVQAEDGTTTFSSAMVN